MGFPTRDRPVPIVPAAVLYDLSVGNDSFIVPDANSGYSACMTANNSPVIEGNVGAGSGASIGKLFGMRHAMKTGLGSAALTVRDLMTNVTITVGAIVALNAVGDVYKNGTLIAGARTMDGKHLLNTVKNLLSIGSSTANTSLLGVATTLACVVTDAKLTKAQAKKVSQMAHDGFARAINPVHTMFDGDIVERAIIRAVEQATGLPDLPSIHELSSTGQNLVFNITLFMFSLISNCLLRK
jgi:L-aminopeptidase/D-esterase-like protein